MESDKLYRVKKEDLPKLEELLNICFAHDPLYETLIPDPDVRKRLMPELFHCDMDEFYETCEIFHWKHTTKKIWNSTKSSSSKSMES